MGLDSTNDVVDNSALWHRWDVSGGCMDRMDVPSPVALPQDMAQMMRLPEEVGSKDDALCHPHCHRASLRHVITLTFTCFSVVGNADGPSVPDRLHA